MTRRCEICGQPFFARRHFHRLCGPCWKDENIIRPAEEAAWRQGYLAGLRAARAEAPAIDRARLRSLVALCHPDRHPPERAALANEVTAWLNAEIERVAA